MDIGMDHVAEDHVPHLIRLDARALDRLADHRGPQFSRWLVLQATTIVSNSGADTAQDDDFWSCHILFSPSAVF